MLVKLLSTIVVFSASALPQTQHPGFGLYQSRTEALPFPVREAESVREVPPRVVSVTRLGHKPAERAEKAFRNGVKLGRKGQDAEAALAFRQASELDPEYSDAFTNLGIALMKSGQILEGLSALEEAIRVDPRNPQGFCNLAGGYGAVNDAAAAERAARQSLALDPGMSPARLILALARAAQSKYDSETLRQARQAATDLPDAHLLAAHVLRKLGRGKEAQL